MSPRILVVGDDDTEVALLKAVLEERHYQTPVWRDQGAVHTVAEFSPIDAVVLDITEPFPGTEQRIRLLRSVTRSPILGLTTLRVVEAMIEQKYLPGVDDLIFRPFEVDELDGRLRLMLAREALQKSFVYPLVERRRVDRRRAQRMVTAAQLAAPSGIHVDLPSKRVILEGKQVKLSPKEYQLMCLLLKNRGTVISDKDIAACLWPNAHYGTDTQVQQYIYRLRQKIEKDPATPRIIVTVKGFGYLLTEPGRAADIEVTEDTEGLEDNDGLAVLKPSTRRVSEDVNE